MTVESRVGMQHERSGFLEGDQKGWPSRWRNMGTVTVRILASCPVTLGV